MQSIITDSEFQRECKILLSSLLLAQDFFIQILGILFFLYYLLSIFHCKLTYKYIHKQNKPNQIPIIKDSSRFHPVRVLIPSCYPFRLIPREIPEQTKETRRGQWNRNWKVNNTADIYRLSIHGIIMTVSIS